MKTPFLALALISFALISCQKDDPQNVRFDTIFAGLTEFMRVETYSPEIIKVDRPSVASFDIDVDSDGTSDLTLETRISASPGSGSSQHATLRLANENDRIFILFSASPDTVYYSDKSDTAIVNGEQRITRSIRWTNLTPSDSISAIRTISEAVPLRGGDEISLGAAFTSAETALRVDEFFLLNGPGEESVDSTTNTVYITKERSSYAHGLFQTDDVQYVGFLFNNRLGWLKLKVVSEGEIHLYEHAIQK